MLIHILAGFFLPWLFGWWLLKREPRMVLVNGPVAAAIALAVNELGFHFYRWWDAAPFREQAVYAWPLDFGLYPVAGSFLIWQVHRRNGSPWLMLALFALGTTLFEVFGLFVGTIRYGNGWNVGWTFVSYVLSYGAGLFYSRLLKRAGIL